MLMFGGEFCDGEGTTVYNDLFRWNVEKGGGEWYVLTFVRAYVIYVVQSMRNVIVYIVFLRISFELLFALVLP